MKVHLRMAMPVSVLTIILVRCLSPEESVELSGVALDYGSAFLPDGATLQLTATVKP